MLINGGRRKLPRLDQVIKPVRDLFVRNQFRRTLITHPDGSGIARSRRRNLQVRGELERTEASLEPAHDAPVADFDKIDALMSDIISIDSQARRVIPSYPVGPSGRSYSRSPQLRADLNDQITFQSLSIRCRSG